MGTTSQHQLTTFSSPQNGDSPIDANVVRGNDNTIKASYNAHDADVTIHVQNGAIMSRPAASVAGQMWLATDAGAVVLSLDTGSAWVEATYLRSTGGTLTGDLLFTDASYDIGKSGATRPRDGFFSRNVAIGGTLNATGAVVLASTLAVTGATTLGALLTVSAGGIVVTGNSTITGTLGGLTVLGVATINATTVNMTAFAATGGGAYNSAAQNTNTTTGFLFLGSCFGQPTGTPASIPSGQIPMIIDSANFYIWLYLSGQWRKSGQFL